jgi:hypothetical protein
MSNIYRVFIFILAASIAACTATNSSTTVAGSDEDSDIGIGGTGIMASSNGKTGSGLGGTGIIGEITGFGSIFVNGIEIEYDDNTTFTIDGETAAPQQLEIGDVVEVLTTDDNEYTQAQIINLRHEVIGKVESVEPETFSFTVNGQSVVQAIHKDAFPEPGSTVAVSGFRIDESTILATRIMPAVEGQKLLRMHTGLPFKGKAERWLVQTHVKIDKVSFELEGSVHTIELEQKEKKTISDRLGIKILQLGRSVSGQLELDRVIEPRSLPRGRNTDLQVTPPVNGVKPGSVPGTVNGVIPGSTPGTMPGISPGSIQGVQPGMSPGSTQGTTQGAQQGLVPTMKR